MWWHEEPEGRGRGLRLVFQLAPELAEQDYQATVLVESDDGQEAESEVAVLTVEPPGASRLGAAKAQLTHLLAALNEIRRGFTNPVRQAMEALTRNRLDQACRQVKLFIRTIEERSGRSLTSEEATHLLADANTLPELLECQ